MRAKKAMRNKSETPRALDSMTPPKKSLSDFLVPHHKQSSDSSSLDLHYINLCETKKSYHSSCFRIFELQMEENITQIPGF